MVFTAIDGSDPATRGTDLTVTTLGDFKLFSNITTGSWKAGYNFTNNKGKCSPGTGATNLSWPDANTYKFFAVSDYANVTQDPAPTVSGDGLSFSYTIPTAYGSQQDLLVATTTGSSSAGTPTGSVTLPFTHALAKIKAIKVYCKASALKSAEVNKYHFRVNSIKIGGLRAKGVYTFGESTWAVSAISNEDPADFEIEIPLKTEDLTFANMSFMPGTKDNGVTMPLTDDGFYLIPQKAEGRTTGETGNPSLDYVVKNAYVELGLQVAADEGTEGWVFHCCNIETGVNWDEESSDANGFQKVQAPLKFDISGGSGNEYTLIIDISQAVVVEDTDNTNRGEGNLVLGEAINITVG